MPIDIRRPLKKFLPHLLSARESNLNEADTVQRVIRFFEDVLGYSALSEITRESNIKDKYVDLAIKMDGTIRFLVEVKAAGTALRDRHTEQAQRYASTGNYRWVVLTNGTAWNLYHLTFEEGIEYERVFSVDLADDVDGAAQCLALLHRQSVRKGEHDEHWAHRLALNAASVGKSLFTEEVLRLLRRDIRKREGFLVDEEDLAAALQEMMPEPVYRTAIRLCLLALVDRRQDAGNRQEHRGQAFKGSADVYEAKAAQDDCHRHDEREDLAHDRGGALRPVVEPAIARVSLGHSGDSIREAGKHMIKRGELLRRGQGAHVQLVLFVPDDDLAGRRLLPLRRGEARRFTAWRQVLRSLAPVAQVSGALPLRPSRYGDPPPPAASFHASLRLRTAGGSSTRRRTRPTAERRTVSHRAPTCAYAPILTHNPRRIRRRSLSPWKRMSGRVCPDASTGPRPLGTGTSCAGLPRRFRQGRHAKNRTHRDRHVAAALGHRGLVPG